VPAELAIQGAIELGRQVLHPPLASGGRAAGNLRGAFGGALQDFGTMRPSQGDLIPGAQGQDPLGEVNPLGAASELL
jgi:hypothetical protein